MHFYILSVLLFGALLANELPADSFPCMHSDRTDAYDKFLYKHVRSDAPQSLDQNKWQAFIKKIKTCNRRVQSFIPHNQKQPVENICSSGGKTFSNQRDLCVSKQEFNFTTVSVNNNCIVTRVISETKYLLLACNEIRGRCLPVHFEPNNNNSGPDNNMPDCGKT
ncbi:hypothetical protein C0J50_22291 [Silurus asotus]|uniref:Ribonuclease A-domain domain-containing protein n=1 Tax=Silurus asotus TaxID=30991 RepID=A0AAD5AM82_SILAS|nr:hypothetical protein C0J50_22291 [Silurus asotus]